MLKKIAGWLAVGALIGAAMMANNPLATHGAGGDCTLDVPDYPLSAAGLATPYLLSGPGCHESDPASSAFVDATILNTQNGDLFTYKPLVIDKGSSPLVKPTVPTLPPNAIVGIGIGFNANSLTLSGPGLSEGHCVNGLGSSIFGQVSYCNTTQFYSAANKAVSSGLVEVPQRGMAKDGITCPSTWAFSIVDQDPVDNTDTLYLVTPSGIAQNTAANRAKFPTARIAGNPSDNRLLNAFVYPALGCTSWQVPDLTDPAGATAPSQHLDELQARFTHMQAQDGHRPALIPLGDPMTQVNGSSSPAKTNLLRAQADQQPIGSGQNDPSTTLYCQGMLQIGLPRVAKDKPFTVVFKSPDAAAANSLFTFIASRFNAAFGPTLLNCTTLLNVVNPVTLTVDANGVVTDAQINLHPGKPGQGQAPVVPMFKPAPIHS